MVGHKKDTKCSHHVKGRMRDVHNSRNAEYQGETDG
jgi:hypothetical protein